MPKITVLPHTELCPQGAVIEAEAGTTICDALLKHDIDIDNACGGVCACTTCHVVVREGFKTLNEIDEDEDDVEEEEEPGDESASRSTNSRGAHLQNSPGQQVLWTSS